MINMSGNSKEYMKLTSALAKALVCQLILEIGKTKGKKFKGIEIENNIKYFVFTKQGSAPERYSLLLLKQN